MDHPQSVLGSSETADNPYVVRGDTTVFAQSTNFKVLSWVFLALPRSCAVGYQQTLMDHALMSLGHSPVRPAFVQQ